MNPMYLVLSILQSILRSLVKFLQDIHFYRPALSPTNIIKYTVDRLLRIIARYGRFRVG